MLIRPKALAPKRKTEEVLRTPGKKRRAEIVFSEGQERKKSRGLQIPSMWKPSLLSAKKKRANA
jgi:hypothetical protein